MRWTTKEKTPQGNIVYDFYDYPLDDIDLDVIAQKVGKLEDIEEKLGIDADTIFKVLEIIKDMRGYKDNEAIADVITIVEESQDFEKFSARCRSFTKEEYDVLKEAFK